MPFGIRRFSNIRGGLSLRKQAVQPHFLEELVVERLSHMQGTCVPPRTPPVHRRFPRSLGIQSPFDEVPRSGFRLLPRNPYQLAQVASYVDVQGFEYPFAFVKSEVVSPSSQDHVQSRNRFEQGRSPGSKENFLQLVSESLKAFGMDSGCPGCANEGIPKEFRFRRSKHAALVAINSQLERPLYKRNHVLECPFCRLSRFGVAIAVVSEPTVLQASFVQIFVKFVQDD